MFRRTIPLSHHHLDCSVPYVRHPSSRCRRKPRSRSASRRTSRSSPSSVIETDPLLNAYVQGIAGNLWNQVARKDVPYYVKIIKDSQINSFATMGGFVYINEGLIDFVQSDDELASVIGHETGHIERRHVITTELEGADSRHPLRHRLDLLADHLRVRRPRRSRHDGEDRARATSCRPTATACS